MQSQRNWVDARIFCQKLLTVVARGYGIRDVRSLGGKKILVFAGTLLVVNKHEHDICVRVDSRALGASQTKLIAYLRDTLTRQVARAYEVYADDWEVIEHKIREQRESQV